MSWRIRTSLVLVTLATMLSVWCMIETTALSMTAFFSLAIPFFGLGSILYIADVLLDLRRHGVL